LKTRLLLKIYQSQPTRLTILNYGFYNVHV